jgi:geranylgeranyl diphosphate synthase type II
MQYQIQHFLPLAEKAIAGLSTEGKPESLYDPVRYFMQLPGKRIRPVFVLQALEIFRNPTEKDARVALCTELFHNFSLVHDDIMDKADLRRGFPTVHIKWNEPTAILAGDALLVMAYDALLEAEGIELKPLIKSFNQMALAVCEGQQLDMDFSSMKRVSANEYLEMIDRKTAALIAFSFELGAFLGRASEEDRKTLYHFGLAMGRCFQLRDDYLDLFGEEEITGKKLGGDIGNSKLTYPVLASMEHPDSAQFLTLWNNHSIDPEERIATVLQWMNSAGIPQLSDDFLRSEMERGMDLINQLKANNHEAITHTLDLCKSLAYRNK